MNPTSTTRRVTANSLWYGLETAVGVMMVFLASVPLARALGPERLGYFTYVGWLCAISSSLGGMGLPAATTRFMALYIDRGNTGAARAVFRFAFRAQVIAAGVLTLGGAAMVLSLGDPRYRTVSLLQIAAIFPSMVGQIPTWANMATERLKKNVPGGLIADGVFLVGVWASLALHWDLVGVAAALLVSKMVESTLRFHAAMKWIRPYPQEGLPGGDRKQIVRYAGQQLYIGLIAAVLWNKSEVVLLKWMSPDIRQITFFTVAYNIIDKVVLLPSVVGSAMSVSVLARTGDHAKKAAAMTAVAARYMSMMAVPLLFGTFMVAYPAVRLVYGPKFVDVGPVLAIGALMAVVKPLISAPDALFRATGKQRDMLIWATVCTAINIGLDVRLIPPYGAVGAAVGNGIGQGLLVLGYLAIAVWNFGVRLDYRGITMMLISGAAMMPPAAAFNHFLWPAPALLCDVLCGAIIYVTMLRVTRVLDASDLARVRDVFQMLPGKLRPRAVQLAGMILGPLPAVPGESSCGGV